MEIVMRNKKDQEIATTFFKAANVFRSIFVFCGPSPD